jgi:aspartyl/asparaginyl beta-hydroxylase (cupin superfamily)
VLFEEIERFRSRVTDDDTRSFLDVRFYKYVNSRLLTRSIHLVDMILCTRDWHVGYAVPLRTVVAG